MALPAFATPLLTGLGTGAGSALIGGLFGGGNRSGGGTDSSAAALQQFALQAAPLNTQLTSAANLLSVLQGVYGGSAANYGNLLTSGQLSQLAEAGNRSTTATTLQGSEVGSVINAGNRLAESLGMGKLSTELLSPQFTYDAGRAVLGAENQLAAQAAGANTDLRKATEESKLAVARDQAYTMGDVFDTRGETKAAMAKGAQELNNALKLRQATDLGSLARIQAEGKRQMALDRSRAGMALTGTRAFA